MTYGILAAKSCLITDIVDQLHEDSKKVNSVERLTRQLNKGLPLPALKSHLTAVRRWVPEEPVIHIDDSDVVKPDGHKFEALGLVRNGPKSTYTKNVYEKGYHVTEACVLTKITIQSVFSPESILPKKKGSHPLMTSPSPPWNAARPCLERPLSSWTEDMMTTRCS